MKETCVMSSTGTCGRTSRTMLTIVLIGTSIWVFPTPVPILVSLCHICGAVAKALLRLLPVRVLVSPPKCQCHPRHALPSVGLWARPSPESCLIMRCKRSKLPGVVPISTWSAAVSLLSPPGPLFAQIVLCRPQLITSHCPNAKLLQGYQSF